MANLKNWHPGDRGWVVTNSWRTLRVVVEVPVRNPNYSVRDLRRDVEALVGGPALNQRNARSNRRTYFGRVQVKEFDRAVIARRHVARSQLGAACENLRKSAELVARLIREGSDDQED